MENPPSNAMMVTATSASNALVRTDELPPIIDISPVGSVIINAGCGTAHRDPSSVAGSESDYQPLIRMRVSEHVLSSASDKFSETLSPMRLPGAVGSQSSGTRWPPIRTKELRFPHDDPYAMKTIMCVLHLRNDLIDRIPNPRELLRIALLADHYDLRRALRLASELWFEMSMADVKARGAERIDVSIDPRYEPPFQYKMESKEIMDLVAAAWLFRQPKTFGDLTAHLAMRHQGSLASVLEDGLIYRAMPGKFWRRHPSVFVGVCASLMMLTRFKFLQSS